MKMGVEKETVLKFIEAINNADTGKISELMSDDHIFIDSGDSRYEGKDFMVEGWKGYFNLFPDYKIEVVDLTASDSAIGIFGYANGTYKGLKDETNSNYFRIPASWKTVVSNGKIKHWQVYCEMKKVEEIINKFK
ncbi:MAG: nuclear transport factor 2 family protein [Bacteroidota bacterium]